MGEQKTDKILRVPSWLNEPYSVLGNPAYRHPSHNTEIVESWRGPVTITTAGNCSCSGTIEQETAAAAGVTDDWVTRVFCGLPSGVRVTRSHQVYAALFDGELYIDFVGVRYNRKVFTGGVRAFDIGNYRYVEQNPRTTSSWAKEARQGKRILWVIRRSDNKYLGRVVEGVLTVL